MDISERTNCIRCTDFLFNRMGHAKYCKRCSRIMEYDKEFMYRFVRDMINGKRVRR